MSLSANRGIRTNFEVMRRAVYRGFGASRRAETEDLRDHSGYCLAALTPKPDEAGERGRILIALDGHDGSGKTTLAQIIAERLGGRVVKPFGSSFGQYMLWLSGQRRYDLLDRAARNEFDRAVAAEPGDYPLIVDRHALTMGMLLAAPWHAEWRPFAHSVLCYADVETVVRRLRKRGEHVGREEKHAHGIGRYRALAARYGIPRVSTNDRHPHDAADEAIRLMGLADCGVMAS